MRRMAGDKRKSLPLNTKQKHTYLSDRCIHQNLGKVSHLLSY